MRENFPYYVPTEWESWKPYIAAEKAKPRGQRNLRRVVVFIYNIGFSESKGGGGKKDDVTIIQSEANLTTVLTVGGMHTNLQSSNMIHPIPLCW